MSIREFYAIFIQMLKQIKSQIIEQPMTQSTTYCNLMGQTKISDSQQITFAQDIKTCGLEQHIIQYQKSINRSNSRYNNDGIVQQMQNQLIDILYSEYCTKFNSTSKKYISSFDEFIIRLKQEICISVLDQFHIFRSSFELSEIAFCRHVHAQLQNKPTYGQQTLNCRSCKNQVKFYHVYNIPVYRLLIAYIYKMGWSLLPGNYVLLKEQLKDIYIAYYPIKELRFTISSNYKLEQYFYLNMDNYIYECNIYEQLFTYQKLQVLNEKTRDQNTFNHEKSYNLYKQSQIFDLKEDVVQITYTSPTEDIVSQKEEVKTNGPTCEQDHVEMVLQIAEFYKQNNKKPTQHNGIYGAWLNLMTSKYKKGILDKEIQQYIEDELTQYGFKWIVTFNTEYHLFRLQQVLKYAQEHNKLPSKRDPIIFNKSLGTWISGRKTAYQQQKRGINVTKKGEAVKYDEKLSDTIYEQLQKYNFVWSQMQLHQDTLEQLLEYAQTHGKLPKTGIKSLHFTLEKRLYIWLKNRKAADVKGKLQPKLKGPIHKLLTEDGYTLFDCLTKEWSVDQIDKMATLEEMHMINIDIEQSLVKILPILDTDKYQYNSQDEDEVVDLEK